MYPSWSSLGSSLIRASSKSQSPLVMRLCYPRRLCTSCRTSAPFTPSPPPPSTAAKRRTFRDVPPNPSLSSVIGLGGFMLLIVPITTFGLGVWQTKRRKWKLNIIAELEEKTTADPIALPQDFSEIGKLAYRKVTLSGAFDHSKEIYIGPRSRVPRSDEQAGGGIMTSGDNVGWLVVTPFELSDREKNCRILVNRGWVPKSRLSPASRPEGQVPGLVDFVGVVRETEKREQFTPKNQTETNKWQIRDIPALAAKLDTQPVFVDADASSSVPGGPIGGQTRVSLRNDHFSYMLTWYSLSAATLYMWAKKFVLK